MNETPLTEKQELQITKDQMEEDLVVLDQNSSKTRKYWKINSLFLVGFVLFSFIYPLIAKQDFLVLIYLTSWVSAALAFYTQVKIFLAMVEGEIKKTSIIILVKAIEDELENIRRKEYDELSRKVQAKRDGADLQGSEQPA